MRTLVILGVVVVLLCTGDRLSAESPVPNAPRTPPSRLVPGTPAPAFVSRDPEGRTVALDDYRNRPIVMNFWATWCAPCRQEMRALQVTYELYKAAGLAVLAVSQDQAESAALVRAYWASMELTFMPLLDPDGSVATHYNVFMLPSTVFIHPSGTVAAVHLGPLTQAQIERYLKAILPQAS